MTKIELITERLVDHLVHEIGRAKSINLLTSFAMKSGVNVLYEPLKEDAEWGAEVKVCVGNYLFITQPEALGALI